MSVIQLVDGASAGKGRFQSSMLAMMGAVLTTTVLGGIGGTLVGCADIWGFRDISPTADGGGASDAMTDALGQDGGADVATCAWTLLPSCPQQNGPCVPASNVTAADGGPKVACNMCFMSTCGAAWNCCGSDPTQQNSGGTVFAACVLLAQCVISRIYQGETYATALSSCEAAGSYPPASESAAEALVQCYLANCTSVCANSM